jgi:hypothetical protein
VSAYPHDGQPIERPSLADRVFWEAIREGLLLVVKAIERRYLPHLRKKS